MYFLQLRVTYNIHPAKFRLIPNPDQSDMLIVGKMAFTLYVAKQASLDSECKTGLLGSLRLLFIAIQN